MTKSLFSLFIYMRVMEVYICTACIMHVVFTLYWLACTRAWFVMQVPMIIGDILYFVCVTFVIIRNMTGKKSNNLLAVQ